jgi:hypothetical protein
MILKKSSLFLREETKFIAAYELAYVVIFTSHSDSSLGWD